MVCLITTTNNDENEEKSQTLMEWENEGVHCELCVGSICDEMSCDKQ